MSRSILDEKFEVMELLGMKALCSEERIADELVPAGLYKYDLKEKEDGDVFVYELVAPYVDYMHECTILTLEPIDFGGRGKNCLYFKDLPKDYYPGVDGTYMTIREFMSLDCFYKDISKSKKANMAYWDVIDHLTETYIKGLAAVGYLGKNLDENDLLEIGKEITEKATEILRKDYGYEFPYVDENY